MIRKELFESVKSAVDDNRDVVLKLKKECDNSIRGESNMKETLDRVRMRMVEIENGKVIEMSEDSYEEHVVMIDHKPHLVWLEQL